MRLAGVARPVRLWQLHGLARGSSLHAVPQVRLWGKSQMGQLCNVAGARGEMLAQERGRNPWKLPSPNSRASGQCLHNLMEFRHPLPHSLSSCAMPCPDPVFLLLSSCCYLLLLSLLPLIRAVAGFLAVHVNHDWQAHQSPAPPSPSAELMLHMGSSNIPT